MEELSAAVDAVIRRSEEERSAALDAAAVSGGEIKADDLDAITEQLERYASGRVSDRAPHTRAAP